MNVEFDTNKGRKKGEILKVNKRTVWVKFDYKEEIKEKGAEAIFNTKTAYIKRHKIKHNVELVGV
jgi:hypothetical protein